MVDAVENEYVNSEIVCTLAALGYLEDDNYYKGDDCIECLKDLIRFLRVDDATCEIRRQLGRSQAVEKDLIPLLKSCSLKEHDIFDVCIRLLVNLTQPAMICFGNVPKGKMEQHWFLEVTSHLQSYKEAFAEKEIMALLGRELGRLLQAEWDSREEEDTLLIERILLLVRNILHVPADPKAEKRTDEDSTIHDQLLWNLHVNGVDDLVLYVASSPDESRWSMHALEIISHMLREQKADVLAKTSVGRTKKEQEEDARELEILYEREKSSKNIAARKGIRHSNFGGTYCMQNLKALNDENKLLYHRPIQRAKDLSFDFGKTAPRKRKNEMLAKEQDTDRKSSLSVRMFLKDFCLQFLEHAYNPLMHIIKDNLKHSRAQENDESYFLWAMRFFMEFNRHHGFDVAYISETLNVPTFQYILILQTKFFDSLTTIKDEKVEWSRRLHLAVRAYQELIQHVALLQLSEDENIQDSAKIIKENVFYVSEYREIFIILLKKFNPCFQTKSFLRDLIEAFHIFLKLLEAHCKNKGHVIVQQKRKKAKRRKKKKTAARSEPVVPLTDEQKEERWQELSADLSSFLQNEDGGLPSIINPFDPVSDVPEEDQKTRCLSLIQQNIRVNSFGEALALLRAAREIWQNSSFGEDDIDPEGEFMCFYEIFRMDVPVINDDGNAETEANGDQEDEMTDPETEEIQAVQVRETEFDFEAFLKKLASPLLLQPYCWLLSWYQENNAYINHYIVKMMYRIAVDLKLHAMLFQLSLFVTFRKVFSDPAVSKYKELVKFSKYILSKFFALLPTNPTLCAELIFWKSPAECYEITEGYGSFVNREVKRSGHSWTFEEEEQLKQLYDEFKDSEDLVENILNAIDNEFRSRRQVVGKLITLGLVENKEILKKKPVNKNEWPEEEQNELRNLFEEFKESDDIVGGILLSMTNKTRSRRQVINQLVKLNIVEDRSILRKKRAKKTKKRKGNEYEEEDGASDSENGGSEEPEAETSDADDESDVDDEIDTDFLAILTTVKKSEHAEQLDWLKTRLNEEADDRAEDDDWQPLPLVTLTEQTELALRDKSFQKLLKKIGLVPPSNEQERYWRIPDNLTPDHLRKAIADIEAEPSNSLESSSNESRKSKVNPKRQKLAELAATLKSSDKRSERARKRKERDNNNRRKENNFGNDERSSNGNSSDESDSYAQEGSREQKQKITRKRRRVRMQESDDSDEDALHIHMEENVQENHDGVAAGEEIAEASQKVGSRHHDGLEDDSASSDGDHPGRKNDAFQTFEGNSGQSDDDHDENRSRKRGRSEEESDSSDDDFDVPLIRTKRARQAVLDDDDDEDD